MHISSLLARDLSLLTTLITFISVGMKPPSLRKQENRNCLKVSLLKPEMDPARNGEWAMSQ